MDITPDTQTVMTLSDYQTQKPSGEVIVRLPVGTNVPVKIEVGSEVFAANAKTTLVFKTGKQIDIEVIEGEPSGIYRINDGKWLERRDAMYTRLFERKMVLLGEGSPYLQRKMILGVDRYFGSPK